MIGLCGCGCGTVTPPARQTDTKRGLVKGEPTRFIRGHAGALAANAQKRAERNARTAPLITARIVPSPPEPPTPREVYAEQLAHLSVLIVGAVHDEGPDAVLAALAAALSVPVPDGGVDPVTALVTVLAAQIDPTTTTGARLGWVDALGTPRTSGSRHTGRRQGRGQGRGAA